MTALLGVAHPQSVTRIKVARVLVFMLAATGREKIHSQIFVAREYRRMADNPYRIGAEINEEIVVATANEIEGQVVTRYLGLVRGIVVRTPSIGKAFIG